MANNGLAVARNIRLWRDQTLSPRALSAVLAGAARRIRDDLIASGEAPPTYTTFVDGRRGASEDAVRPDGVIRYQFNLLGVAAQYALGYCITRSPVDSGDFRRAWVVAVDGKLWAADLDDIPPGAEVFITNPMPYARKVDVGGMRMSVPPGIVEEARQRVASRFPGLKAERVFLSLPGGDYPVPAGVQVPYILKGHAFRSGLSFDKRTGAFLRKHPRQRTNRADTKRGMPLVYPALVLAERG